MTIVGAGAWFIAALALAILELVVPGVFLVFLGVAAGVTGAIMLALPATPLELQLASFAVWSVVAVVVGRRWYRDFAAAGDKRLNDPVARLIGETVVVEQAIVGGRGRVIVGDGSWPARGVDMAIGTVARVTDVADGMLEVEPIDPSPVIPAQAGIQMPSGPDIA